MKLTLHVKEEDVTYTFEGDTLLDCAIKLLQEIKGNYAPSREYLKETFEGLMTLSEENEYSYFDFSNPEGAFSLKLEGEEKH